VPLLRSGRSGSGWRSRRAGGCCRPCSASAASGATSFHGRLPTTRCSTRSWRRLSRWRSSARWCLPDATLGGAGDWAAGLVRSILRERSRVRDLGRRVAPLGATCSCCARADAANCNFVHRQRDLRLMYRVQRVALMPAPRSDAVDKGRSVALRTRSLIAAFVENANHPSVGLCWRHYSPAIERMLSPESLESSIRIRIIDDRDRVA